MIRFTRATFRGRALGLGIVTLVWAGCGSGDQGDDGEPTGASGASGQAGQSASAGSAGAGKGGSAGADKGGSGGSSGKQAGGSAGAAGSSGKQAGGPGGSGGAGGVAGSGGTASSGGAAGAGAAGSPGGEAGAAGAGGSSGEQAGAPGAAGAPPVDLTPKDQAENPEGYADADGWNFPSDNYFVCGKLKNASAPLRFSDFGRITENGDYDVKNDLSSDECGQGKVRFDLHEILQSTQGRLLFHKGGQGYSDPKTPYGHLWIADLESPSPKPQVENQPPEYGAPSKIPGTDTWDWTKRNGRGCTPTGDFDYRIRVVGQDAPDALPAGWQYKPNQTSSRFNKYADAGPEQGAGTAHYAYLLWSWLHQGDGKTTSKGGGQVRVLLRDGQVFERCPVDSIDSVAYAADTDTEAGRVTAIYGKTRASADGPWVYGWAIHSHRPRNADGSYGPRVYHLSTCPAGGC